VKTYLTILVILSIISFTSGYASADIYTDPTDSYERGLRDDRERQAVTNTLQRRMNQQYYNDRLQGEIQQQQNDMYYQQQQEHMRNQGWGRPGLDGGGR
jgi:hypothetical protein